MKQLHTDEYPHMVVIKKKIARCRYTRLPGLATWEAGVGESLALKQ